MRMMNNRYKCSLFLLLALTAMIWSGCRTSKNVNDKIMSDSLASSSFCFSDSIFKMFCMSADSLDCWMFFDTPGCDSTLIGECFGLPETTTSPFPPRLRTIRIKGTNFKASSSTAEVTYVADSSKIRRRIKQESSATTTKKPPNFDGLIAILIIAAFICLFIHSHRRK